jgi:hypothetical protein
MTFKTFQKSFKNLQESENDEVHEMGCEHFRVGRTKRGEVRLEIQEPTRAVWMGFTMTDGDARALADALCREAKPTAADLTLDNSMEP